MTTNNTYTVQESDGRRGLTGIAEKNGLSLEQFLLMNPDRDPDRPIRVGEELVIPSRGFVYNVGDGEVLSTIAGDKGVSVSAILAANPDIPDANSVRGGQDIVIPQEYFVYEVQKGDWNISMLADRFSGMHISADDIRRANPTLPEDGSLMLGQELTIPTGYMAHEVRPGEWLTKIGRDTYNLTLAEMQAANPQLEARDWDVRVGDQIRIPSPGLIRDFTVAADALENISAPEAERDYPSAYNIPAAPVQSAWNGAVSGEIHVPVADDPNARPLIVIDLGHGSLNARGWLDPGNISADGEVTEMEIVDSVGANLAQQLYEKGYQVAFTRNPGEVFLYQGEKGGRLGRLGVRANHAINLERELASPYTVFVSLHVNSAPGTSGSGFEVRIPRTSDDATLSANSEALGGLVSGTMDPLHPADFRRLGMQNLAMFRTFADQAYGDDAAILVELDFLNNDAGRARLEDMRDKPYTIAAGIRKGIENYITERSPGLDMTQYALKPEGGGAGPAPS